VTSTTAPRMSADERLAAEAFHTELVAECNAIKRRLVVAFEAHDVDAMADARAELRVIYREIHEVAYALKTGILPL
jgi:hypothetical protein